MPIRNVTIALALAMLMAAPSQVAAQRSAKARYDRTLAREQRLEKTRRAPPLSQLREAVRDYEQIARRYPTSGYSDNALYNGGLLALETYRHYQHASDREAGVKMLEWMIREYPASSLRAKARARLRAAGASTNAGRDTNDGDVDTERAEPAPGALATARSIERTDLPGAVRVTVELDREFTFHQDTLGNPPRVFVDLQGVKPGPALREAVRFDEDDVVREVRVGTRGKEVTRVVLELHEEARHQVSALSNPYRLVIDVPRAEVLAEANEGVPNDPEALEGSTDASSPSRREAEAGSSQRAESRVEDKQRNVPQPFPTVSPPSAEPTRADAPADETPMDRARSAPGEVLPTDPPGRTATSTEATGPPVEPPPAAPEEPALPTRGNPNVANLPAPRAPEANGTGRFSMSRQLGLGIARVVIDPGHGGHDPGTRSNGVVESELVLDVALRLEQLLKRRGVDVILTRRTDEFIDLEERAPIANRHKADLFLSIHANASPNRRARGIETYVLNFASDKSAEEVAARENATSAQTMQDLPNIVEAIALNNKLDESQDLAEMVQASMVGRLRDTDREVADRGVKKAPFVVLIGAKMPAILAEIAFVSNRQEAGLLKTSAYRDRIAGALEDAVLRYQRSLKSSGTVTEQ
ncbi:MAG: AMIN domain-containing protein [Luteitalea sp.]|nr:AMIN domain-containing protein [Luteitalea sp.]